ncbi:MAG: hypothetical protein ACHP7N_17015 [Caulobacterales bacterium]
MTPAILLALTLMATNAPPPESEPLPPGAPTDDYQLAAWCYGALDEYLTIYEKVKPDLRDIDKMFGTSVVEAEPYQSDMAAAHKELKVIGNAVTLAEKASPRPIAPQGVVAMRGGRLIWSVVEAKTERELARAWLTWALPDRCDSVSRTLATRSALLGKALTYNTGSALEAPAEDTTPETTPEPQAPTPTPIAEPEAHIAAPPAETPSPQAAVVTPSAQPAPSAEAAPEPTLAPVASQQTAEPPSPAPASTQVLDTQPAAAAETPPSEPAAPTPSPAAPAPQPASTSDQAAEPML